MTDLFLFLFFIMISFFALKYPYVATMGYIWVDSVKPQTLGYGFMAGKPLSFIMAGICVVSYAIHFKKHQVHHSKGTLTILLIFSIWVTITTLNALFPEAAWVKWNDAIKVLLFSALMPLFISTKAHFEAAVASYAVSTSIYVLAVGVKTLFGGGGYNLTLIPGGGVWAESSTFATLAVMMIPFYSYFSNTNVRMYSLIPFRKIIVLFSSLLAVLAVIGSTARTGLIGLVILVAKMYLESKNKIKFLIVCMFCGLIAQQFLFEDWIERMNTLNDIQSEGSAMGRVVVWKWTWDFTKTHPFGAGFVGYMANSGQLNAYIENPDLRFEGMKAYHSIYFEVLGEHGYLGLVLYLLLVFLSFRKLNRIKKESKDAWMLAGVSLLKIELVVFLVCGNFIGVAFQPTFYLLIAFVISLYNIHVNQLSLAKVDVGGE